MGLAISPLFQLVLRDVPGRIAGAATGGMQAFQHHHRCFPGQGTLDGAGRPIWDQFWRERNAAADKSTFRNVGVPRARLALIERSRGVVVDGVTFKDSQFWNLHLYHCEGVAVHNARFEVPDDYKQGEKRPMIVSFYEKNSQNLNRYVAPSFVTGMGALPVASD